MPAEWDIQFVPFSPIDIKLNLFVNCFASGGLMPKSEKFFNSLAVCCLSTPRWCDVSLFFGIFSHAISDPIMKLFTPATLLHFNLSRLALSTPLLLRHVSAGGIRNLLSWMISSFYSNIFPSFFYSCRLLRIGGMTHPRKWTKTSQFKVAQSNRFRLFMALFHQRTVLGIPLNFNFVCSFGSANRIYDEKLNYINFRGENKNVA